jgi:hypothetical protein
MTAEMLLDELAGLGIHLECEGEAIFADVQEGSDITPHVERIKAHKPALLRELLQRQIMAAVSVEPELFNRDHYDQLCVLWHAHDARGESGS